MDIEKGRSLDGGVDSNKLSSVHAGLMLMLCLIYPDLSTVHAIYLILIMYTYHIKDIL